MADIKETNMTDKINEDFLSALDSDQKGAVKVEKNAVVSAGAGSGKTRVLAKRFSYILLRDKNCRVDQILTLTFTKKATVEMNERIYRELEGVCPEKAKDFFKANIKTLDSYCAQVAKLGCHYYGISPDFTEGEDEICQRAKSLALSFLLKNRDNPGIQALIAGSNYDKIADDLFVKVILKHSLIAKEIDWDNCIELQKKYVCEEYKRIVNKMLDIKHSMVNELVPLDGKNTVYLTKMRELLQKPDPEIPEIDFNDSESNQRYEMFDYFHKISRVPQNGARGEILDPMKELQNELREVVSTYVPVENYIYGFNYVKEIVPLVKEFCRMMNDFKRKTGLFSFADISSLAERVLREHPEIRQLEKEKYKYIMIDEFQDNNMMQKNLLFMLAEKESRTGVVIKDENDIKVSDLEPDKLFFVGDEKQSIYRFRGADVSVFRRLSEDFKEGNLELKKNYRSHPSLIKMFNAIFGGMDYNVPDVSGKPTQSAKALEEEAHDYSVFYTEQTQARGTIKIPDYEAVYRNVETKDPVKEKLEPRMTVALLDKKSSKDKEEDEASEVVSEASWVVKKIKEITTEGINGKVYSPNDIAILFRATTNQKQYENLLLQNEIPYTTENVTGFYSDGPVNDISAMLRLAAYPKDTLAFASVLRSSFVNLSFEETESILAVFDESQTLFAQDAAGVLEGRSLERYKAGQEIYARVLEFVQDKTNAEIVTYLWYETGYRYETFVNKKTYMYSSLYDMIFELARKADADNLGIAEFLSELEQYKDKKLEGMEIPLDDEDGVQIMTIHKSKGLEFPVVFVVDCGRKGKNDLNDSAVFYDEEFGIAINTPPSPSYYGTLSTKGANSLFFSRQKELRKKMTAAEIRRVLYVAVTRAEDYVFLCGNCDFAKYFSSSGVNSEEKTDKDIFLDLLNPVLCNFIDAEFNLKDGMEEKCPFKIEKIEYASNEEIKFDKRDKTKFIDSVLPLYEAVNKNGNVIKTEIPVSPYILPSGLYHDDEKYESGKTEYSVDQKIPYWQIDRLVADSVSRKDQEAEFTYANFGTVAHYYLESCIKGQEPQMLNREVTGLHGSAEKLKILTDVCNRMCSDFKENALGKKVIEQVKSNRFVKSEYSFKSRIGKKIVNGQIDLVFENESGGFTIVDYKTNREVKPEIYYIQLACYRQAVAKMMGVDEEKITCVLYYLRYDKEVDVTAECSKINIEECVNKL